jgi:hypothetical protein
VTACLMHPNAATVLVDLIAGNIFVEAAIVQFVACSAFVVSLTERHLRARERRRIAFG